MIKWFKKYFIPHEGNNHRPHFLHNKNTRNVISFILFIELILFVLPKVSIPVLDKSNLLATVLPAVLDDLTNQNRNNVNLPSLKENSLLDQAAELKAKDMATKGYFAHNSPEGKTSWYWFDQVGYKYIYAGENLAINFSDSKDVVNAWMNSPTHKANILKAGYSEVGTGLATGLYNGAQAIFVVQLYASPQMAEATPVKVAMASVTPSLKPEPKATEPVGKVLGESTTSPTITPTQIITPSFIQKLLASPHQTTNTILLIILMIVVLAIILNLSIKINLQHPDLITNGLILLAIIVAIYLINNNLSARNTSIGVTSNTYYLSTTTPQN